MSAVSKQWNRRFRNGSVKDNGVDEGIWDRNDSAFLDEVSRSRHNSIASTSDIHGGLRPYLSSPDAQHGSYDASLQGSRRPSAHALNSAHQAATTFRMPFELTHIHDTRGSDDFVSPLASAYDLRRPSVASTVAGAQSPAQITGAATPSRSGILSSLKRIVGQRGSKKSDTTGGNSDQGSPVLDPYRRRPSQIAQQIEHAHFSTLPPGALCAPVAVERLRSPEQLEHDLSLALGAAISDLRVTGRTYQPRQDQQGHYANRQMSAPFLSTQVPADYHTSAISPASGFAAWQERGSFNGTLPTSARADVSPTRAEAPRWNMISPTQPRHQRSFAYLHTPGESMPMGPGRSEAGSFRHELERPGLYSHDVDPRPMRPRRSEDLHLGTSQADHDTMSAFNEAHEKRWSGAAHSMERQGSGLLRRLSSRRRSDVSPQSLLFSPTTSDTPALSPNVSASPATTDGNSPVFARTNSAQGSQLGMPAGSLCGGGANSMQRRRSLNPFDGKRLSVIFPTAGGHHGLCYGKNSPVTPSSISRPLSVCSSTFDSISSNTGRTNSYAPSFATSFMEPSLPSPRMTDSAYGLRKQTPSSLDSASDTQEELEAPQSWQSQYSQHPANTHFHPSSHPFGQYSLKRPSSSSTTQSEFPVSAYQTQVHAGARHPGPLQQPQRQAPTAARPKSATAHPSHGYGMSRSRTGRPAAEAAGPALSRSRARSQRRRPSFGLNIAPTAAAAFDCIPAPSMASSIHSSRSPRGRSRALDSSRGSLSGKRSTRSSVEQSTTEEEGDDAGAQVDRELLGDGAGAGAATSSSPSVVDPMTMLDGAEPTEDDLALRRPVSDAPVTPDLNADMDGAMEYDFGMDDAEIGDVEVALPEVAIEPTWPGHAPSHSELAPNGSGPAEDDNSSALELLADESDGASRHSPAFRHDDNQVADAEMAAKAPLGLVIHTLSKNDHAQQKHGQHQRAVAPPKLFAPDGMATHSVDALGRRRSSQGTAVAQRSGYGHLYPHTHASSVEALGAVPTPTYSYL